MGSPHPPVYPALPSIFVAMTRGKKQRATQEGSSNDFKKVKNGWLIMMYFYGVITQVFLQAIQTVCEQYARELMRISQLATNRVEEKLKAKRDMDKVKIESLEAELAKMHIVAKKSEEELVSAKTALSTAKSWRQKLGKAMVSTKHHFFKMHQHFVEVKRIWTEEFTNLADRLNEQRRVLSYTMAYKLFTS